MIIKLSLRQPLLAIVYNTYHQQSTTYLAPSLPDDVKQRLKKHRKIILTEDDFRDALGLPVKSTLSVKRERWARFGSQSGVNYAELFPSEQEIAEEQEAELRWWPTIEQMQASIKQRKDEELKQQQEYEQKIAENMAKMPEWIAKYEEEQRSMEKKELLRQEEQMIEEDQAREKIGYDVPSKHPVLQEYLFQQREKLRKEKKRLLKEAKKSLE